MNREKDPQYAGSLKCHCGEYMTPVHMPTAHGRLEIDMHRSYQEIKKADV